MLRHNCRFSLYTKIEPHLSISQARKDVEHLKTIFDEFDINKDGRLSLKEIILCFRRFGQNPTEEMITKKMALINPTASKLTFPEFCEMMANTIHYYDLEFSLGKIDFRFNHQTKSNHRKCISCI